MECRRVRREAKEEDQEGELALLRGSHGGRVGLLEGGA